MHTNYDNRMAENIKCKVIVTNNLVKDVSLINNKDMFFTIMKCNLMKI